MEIPSDSREHHREPLSSSTTDGKGPSQDGGLATRPSKTRVLLVGSGQPINSDLLNSAGVDWAFTTAEGVPPLVLEARLSGFPFSGLVVELASEDPYCALLKVEPLLYSLPILFLESHGWSVHRATPVDIAVLTNASQDRPTDDESAPSGRELTILVVDDVPVNRKFLVYFLRQLGHRSIEAANSEEALRFLHGQAFDLILMDVEMPGRDGLETTRLLRDSEGPNRNVPVLAVTGHAGESERTRLLRLGMDDVLTKPVNRERLADKIEQWAGQRILLQPARKSLPSDALDISNILQVTQGNAEMLAELIDVFSQDIAACLIRLERTLTENDKAAFLACARAIAGAAATVGAGRLEQTARSATDESWPDQAQTVLLALRQESQRVEEFLHQGLREPDIVECEFTSAPHLDAAELALIDLHSFLNIFNVIASELYFLGDDLQAEESLRPCRSLIESFAQELQQPAILLATLRSAPEVFGHFWDLLEAATRDLPDQKRVSLTTDNLRSILAVTATRIAELESRIEFPERWVAHDIDALMSEFQKIFAAIEKNSKGRYHIVFNVAAKADDDYLIHLNIQSVDGPTITMPAVLQDVLRDLMANARKYTNPGGTIQAGLVDDGTTLRLAVEDTGLGIPAQEVPRVVEMGYRASNMSERPTMGGGFGLTKAYWVATRFGGSMKIRSGRNRGTRVVITIPRPNPPEQAHSGGGSVSVN